MKDRIKELMAQLSLSAAELADKIGVQRSSISHILSGRNLPGSQFIEKLLNTFPEVDARWLMTGRGGVFKSDDTIKPEISKRPEAVHTEEIKTPKAPKEEIISTGFTGKKIEKVLFFYSDRSFSEYYPL